MRTRRLTCLAALTLPALTSVRAIDPPNGTLLFQNLKNLVSSFSVDNQAVAAAFDHEGPKGLAVADLDGDGLNDLAAGNLDGTVAVLFGAAGGAFEPVRHLDTNDARGLRDVIAANVLGDALPEIIAANPFSGKLYIFSLTGDRKMRNLILAQTLTTWPGARAVAAGDFNGDGKIDLAVAGAGGPGAGFVEYRGDGSGGFTAQTPTVATIPSLPFDPAGDSAKPVFTIHVWRHLGETRDRVVVSFTEAGYVWFLGSQPPGQPLAVTYTLPLLKNPNPKGGGAESVYDLAMGYFSAESRVSGEPDLLTAVTSYGEVFIRRYTGGIYPTVPQQRLAAPAGPRALSIADVNGDTWPDLLIAARQANTLSLYLNNQGVLSLSSQTSTGNSPRDVVSADFDGDGMPDAAVINRVSQDVTVHRIDPNKGWFWQSPLVQRTVGGASAPSIRDIDGDGRNELLYLTPATGDANIQKLDPRSPNGASVWLPPVRYFMGVNPQTLSTPDINGDGLLDLQCASLGDLLTSGGLSYRLQLRDPPDPDHIFGPLINISAEAGAGGPTGADVFGDFDHDGRIDEVLYEAGTLYFYKGVSGGFKFSRKEPFVDGCRALAAVDLNRDGALDLVGVGAFGYLEVVENNGQWFTGGPYHKTVFPHTPLLAGVYAFSIDYLNDDPYPDLTVFATDSVTRWNGGPKLTFDFIATTMRAPTRDVTGLDFDGDGIKDTFVLSRTNTKASFYKGVLDANGEVSSLPEVPYRIPSSNGLASGDLDGDGLPDLAGAGEYLWVALSKTPAPSLVPTVSPVPAPEIPGVVINEVLASTTDFIPQGATEPVDCVEIFNGSAAPVNVTGWILRRVGASNAPDFNFPNFILEPRGLAVIYCSESSGSPWQAPFKLPTDGGTLQLLNANGELSDMVSYPVQQPDISYARLFDGSRSFVYNPFPSIGSTNYDNGNIGPKLAFKGVDTALLKSGKWRFRAHATAANGMFTVIIYWREIPLDPKSPVTLRTGTIPLFDDGMHDDGASLDGIYAGDWDQPLEPGKPIEFYITATDLRWEEATDPESPQFTPVGQTIGNFTLAVPTTPSGWEISEVVPINRNGLKDEHEMTPDWAELRYTGLTTTSVQNLFLSDSLYRYDTTKLYDLSRLGAMVSPGSTNVVFLDDTPINSAGAPPRHAPFKLNGDGDSIFLIRRLPSGATELVDSVKIPDLSPDVAYARLGPGGPFVQTQPTPGGSNARVGGWVHAVPGLSGGTDCIFAFPGGGRVEASSDLRTWTTVMQWMPNNGIERTYREAVRGQRFFRVR